MREPRAKEVEKVKQALVTFLMTTNQGTPPFPPANMTTYRKVLPYLSELDKKWMIVREDAFTQTSYYHFKRVADIWRSQLRSKQLKKLIADAQEETHQGNDYDDEEDQESEKD